MTKKTFLQIIQSSLAKADFAVDAALSKSQWNEILVLAKNHRIIPLVYDCIYKNYPFDKADLEPFKAHTKRLVYEQTLKTQNFLEVYEHLIANGMEPIVVKGIVCRSLYPDPECRTSSDEDILIPADKFDKYCSTLAELSIVPISESAREKYQTTFLRGGKHPIEIHKSLFPTESNYFAPWNNLFADAFDTSEYVNVQHLRIRTLGTTDHLLYLTLHALKHFVHSGVGIRQVCDIVLFANNFGKSIDWQRYFASCRNLHAEQFTLAIFKIGENHLVFDKTVAAFPENISLESIDEAPLLEDILGAGVFGSATMSRRHSANFTFDAVQGKKTNALKRAFPSRKSLSGRYMYAKKCPLLLPVAWVHRLINYHKETTSIPENRPSAAIQTGRERLALLELYGLASLK